MKRALGGTAKVDLRDGADQGRQPRRDHPQGAQHARRRSQPPRGGRSAGDKTQKTDFSELTASFTIKNGVAHNEDLEVKAPLFRLGGAGDINIATSSLDYVAKASDRRHVAGPGRQGAGPARGPDGPGAD